MPFLCHIFVLYYTHGEVPKSKICPAEMVMRDTADYENILTGMGAKKPTPPQTAISSQ